MSTRRATIAGVVLVLIAGIAWKLRDHSDAHEATTAPSPTSTTAARPASQPAPVAVAPSAPRLHAGSAADDTADRPQPVPLPPGETPPPLDGKKSEPAPPQKAFTPAELIAKREADLKLLDDTKARLEQELAAAKGSNDATTAHDLEVRIARLTELRKKRGSELDQLKGSAQ